MPGISSDGAEIHYEFSGRDDGPVLAFSNSLGTNLNMWDEQARALGERYRVLRYDSRGHGQSDAPDGEYTIDMLGRDFVRLLDALEIDKVDYCGLSKGGMVGQWLGVNAPERIGRLVLCNTSSHLPPRDLWDGRIKMVREQGMAAIVDAVVERWFTPEFIASGDQAALAKVREMILSTPPQGYAGCCAAIRDMDQREAIAAIDRPTLVIVGRDDPATPVEHAELIASRIPGARLHVIEAAAHLSNIEQEQEFTRTLGAFLG